MNKKDWDVVELINDKDAEILDLKEQNTRLQSELDKQKKDNRKMVKVLKEIRNWLHNEFSYGWKKIGKEYFFLMEPDWAQTNYNDIVLDTFAGSCPVAFACHNLNRSFICIEKDKDYYEASIKRLEEHKRQGRLF